MVGFLLVCLRKFRLNKQYVQLWLGFRSPCPKHHFLLNLVPCGQSSQHSLMLAYQSRASRFCIMSYWQWFECYSLPPAFEINVGLPMHRQYFAISWLAPVVPPCRLWTKIHTIARNNVFFRYFGNDPRYTLQRTILYLLHHLWRY